MSINHIMKLKLFCFIVFLAGLNQVNAQYLEGGVFIGTSNYLGDLQPKHYTGKENNIAFGLTAKYWIKDYVAVRAAVMRGRISGEDYNSTVATGRRQRNLSFSSKLWEFGAQVELHPLPFFFDEDEYGLFSPYLMGGISVFSFNPKAYINEEWHDLHPLGTEGQNLEGSGVEPYDLTQISIPFGAGIMFKPTHYNTISIELGMRATFTDYLDDISTVYPDMDALRAQSPLAAQLSYRTGEYQATSLSNPQGRIRGNPGKKDWYMFLGINFFYDFTEMLNLPNNSNRWY